MRRSIEENMVLQQVVDATVKNTPPATFEEVTRFYNENPKFFDEPERVRASHILIRTTPESTPAQKEEARKKLETIRQEIESRKITFADAATKNSQDPGSAQKGGDLGFFARGAMVKPFDDAAFNAQVGTLSSIVETQFGYHLIQVAEHRPAGKKTLEAAGAEIKNFLERKAKQDKLQAHLQELKTKTPVEVVMPQEEWAKRHGGK
jgi:parvulin-like peptidyl-prolyl isomerase